MKRALVLVLVACSAPTKTTAKVPTHPPTTAQATDQTPGLPPSPVPTQHKLHDVIEAPHAGSIVQVALTPDGATALSSDELGGIRLWPSLDGSAEPRVVDLPMPKQLAIGRRGDGFTIVSLDEVGGLYIAKLDATARTLSHVSVSPEPAVTGMAMTDLGLLAWRADQTVVLLDENGATKGQLATEPRQRIVSIGVSHKRAIAILEKDATKRIVRWLTLEPALAWASTIDLGGDPGQEIALSPSATRYAVQRKDDRSATVQLIDVAKKKVIASAPVVATGVDLAFVDDDVLAIGTFEGINWIDATLPMPVMAQVTKTTGARITTALAAGAGHAVTTQNGELVIATPTTTSFLGYDLIAPRFVEAAPGGQLLIGLRDTFAYLDAKLQSTTTQPLVPNVNVIQLLWLGGDDWLVEQAAGNGTLQLTVADVVKNTQTIVRSGMKESNILMYEPSTQLVTLSFGAVSEVTRYDAKKKQLEHVASVAKPSAYEQVLLAPLAPKLAGGNQIVHVAMRDKPTIKWVRDARAIDKAASSVTIEGSYAGTDPAGHVYLWRAQGGGTLELTVYADGKPIATLPSQGPNSLWPDPTGTRVVGVGPNQIGLYSSTDGKRLWTQELAAVQEAIWLTDGALAITSAGGIARLDPATGTVMAARCGWRFGLSTKPHPPTSRVEPLCAQLDR
ncbi:MAG TPA: hypothetical protein VLB44_11000 [Kofleriaceae bacterium]|nr:hypothetical protein [Kofleriaceae bacterium]